MEGEAQVRLKPDTTYSESQIPNPERPSFTVQLDHTTKRSQVTPKGARRSYSLRSHHRRWRMAKYLIAASYTAEGAKGLLKEGGTKRRQAAEQAIKSAGGTLEAFYFAFGDTDVL